MPCTGPLLGCCDGDVPSDEAGYQKVRLNLRGCVIPRPGDIFAPNDNVRGAVLAALAALPWPGGPVGASTWDAFILSSPVLVSSGSGPDPDSFPYERRTALIRVDQSPTGADTAISGYAIKVRLTRAEPSYACIREFDSATAFEEFGGNLVGCNLEGTALFQLTSQPPTTGDWIPSPIPGSVGWSLARSFDCYLGILANMDPCCNPAP